MHKLKGFTLWELWKDTTCWTCRGNEWKMLRWETKKLCMETNWNKYAKLWKVILSKEIDVKIL